MPVYIYIYITFRYIDLLLKTISVLSGKLDITLLAQLARVAEYTDCISAECSGYDTKQFDGEAPLMLDL